MKFQQECERVDGWKTLARETHFENANLAVASEEVSSPGSTSRRWTVVHRKPAVVVAPMTADGMLILIRQERIPIRAAIWEVPAGQIDEPGRPELHVLQTAALRELREETGYELSARGSLISLGDYFSSPGFTDEQGYFFLAQDVEPSSDGSAHTDSEAILDCRAFTPAEITRMITENELRDANTLSICAKLLARGFLVLQK